MTPARDARKRGEYEMHRRPKRNYRSAKAKTASRVKERRKASRARHARRPPKFIGVDGEGLHVPDGTPQPYVLFAANNGTYVEGYDDENPGLTSIECLDFLLGLAKANPGAVLVVFGGSYDMTQSLRDLPEDDARQLAETGEVVWRAERHRFYSIRFFPGKLLQIVRTIEHPVLREARPAKARMTLYDVFGYFQTSFVNTLRQWDIGTDEQRERILAMKDRRDEFGAGEVEAIRAYCLEECVLLVDLMDKVAQAVFDADIPVPRQWHGAGSLADSLLADHYMGDALAELDPQPDAVDRAYYGGRIETMLVGPVSGPLYEYDINSAYPAAIVELPPMAGRWVAVGGYDPMPRHAVFRVKWDVRDHPAAAHITPFPVRRGSGIWWPTTGEGWYLAVEVRAAIAAFGPEHFEVSHGWIFAANNPDARPWSWIGELYERRLALKREDDRNGTKTNIPVKLALNSMYGKTAQSGQWRLNTQTKQVDIHEGRWRNTYVAAYATARTRAAILTVAIQSPEHVVSIATDSVAATVPLSVTEGARLGEWEAIKHEQNSIVIHSGFIIPEGAGGMKVRVRGGMNPDLDYDDFADEWIARGIAGNLASPRTNFLGLRLAAARGKVGLRGAWYRDERSISFAPAQRVPTGDLAGHIRGEYLMLAPPDAPSGEDVFYMSEPVGEPSGRQAMIRWGRRDELRRLQGDE